MDPLIIALIVAVFTLLVLFSGIPIAFGLSFVSIALLVTFEGFQMLDVFAETFFAGLNSFICRPSLNLNRVLNFFIGEIRHTVSYLLPTSPRLNSTYRGAGLTG